ncbi:MAG: protein kinase [Acidobacteriaceae bacterium]|jgi:Tol biopolymer transport system component
MMTDPRQSAEELFGEALELPVERRSAFLDQACRDAPELRRRVERLLEKDQQAGSFLGNPAFTPDGSAAQTAASTAVSPGRFQAGQLIADRFSIVRFIARGGMGEVYEAKDQFLQDASVALKIIRPEIAADATASARFQQEVVLARKVVHSNLCPIYEIFRCDQPAPPFLFLSMRLLQGQTLYARFQQPAKLEPGEAVNICNQLLAGVAALHAGGIIHRDLKPNNVMLETDSSHVSIMDFGLARPQEAENTLFGSGVIAGTPGYMAPEMLRGERPTKATDLFALGIVLHQVLTGERPVVPGGLAVVPSPALRSARAPAELIQAVESFLSSDPDIRVRAFERVVTGRDGTTQVPAFSRLQKRMLAYIAAAVVAVMLLVFAVKATRSPGPAPLDSTQLTFSAEPKDGPLFTDGARIYLNSRGIPSEMAASGGPVVPLHILGPGIFLQDILPDGSQALGWKAKPDDEVGRGTLWTASMLGGEPRKLTDHLAEHALWSPEGRAVVFSDQRTLYKVDEDGRNLRKIWDAPGDLRALSFSPDGRQLSVTVGVSATVGADSAPTRLWSVGADGQNAHPLRLDWPANASQDSGQWTPNGQHFVFSSDREERTNLYELATPPWFAFWRKPTAARITGNQLPILAATPMRDSQGLFVLGKTDEGAMRAYDPRSKKLLPYLDDLSMIEFVISPDRQWMAYSEYPSRRLWKSRLDGSERVQLTSSIALMQQWSPDGKWLAYTSFHNVYLVSAAGGAPEKLTPDGIYGVAPSWFPDGKSIAFNNYPYPDKPFGIHVIDLATRRISDMPGADQYYVPSWSPDGKYMVAMAQNPPRMVLYSAQTKTWRDLRTFDVPWGYWVWASDSKSIYMGLILGNNGIYQLTVPQGEWKHLCGLAGVNDPQGADSFLSLTPDGQPAIMSRTGVGQIYSLRWPR